MVKLFKHSLIHPNSVHTNINLTKVKNIIFSSTNFCLKKKVSPIWIKNFRSKF